MFTKVRTVLDTTGSTKIQTDPHFVPLEESQALSERVQSLYVRGHRFRWVYEVSLQWPSVPLRYDYPSLRGLTLKPQACTCYAMGIVRSQQHPQEAGINRTILSPFA